MDRLEHNRRLDRNGKIVQTGDRVQLTEDLHRYIPACSEYGTLDYTRKSGRCDVKLDTGETMTIWPQDLIRLHAS